MALLSNFNQISTSSGTPINMIQGSDSPIGWTGTNAVVATETSPALIPYHPLKTTAIRINSTSANGYGSTTFTVPAGVPATLMGISFGFESNDTSTWLVQLWQGATQQTLSVGFINGTTTPVTFNTTAVLTGGLTYELRIISVLNNKTCYINNVTASLNLAAPANIVGSVVSEWQSFTPSTSQGFGTITVTTAQYRRVGSSMEVFARFDTGTVTGDQARFGLPSGFNVSVGANVHVGDWQQGSAAATTRKRGRILATNGVGYVLFSSDDYTTAAGPFSSLLGNAVSGSANAVSVQFTVPIAEWAGNGTVNLGPGAQVEYASNDGSGGTAANIQYTTGSVSGPSGSAFVSVNSATVTAAECTDYVVNFQYPIQNDDAFQIEILFPSATEWVPISEQGAIVASTLTRASNAAYGIGIFNRNSTSIWVRFGNGGRVASGGYGSAGAAWSSLTTYRWRVRKAKASSPVGFGLATATDSGLSYQNRFQRKVLGSNITSSGAISDFTFNNLVIGRIYRLDITGRFVHISSASNEKQGIITITHSGSTLYGPYWLVNPIQTGDALVQSTSTFVATSTTITMSVSLVNMQLWNPSYASLTEMNDTATTTAFS